MAHIENENRVVLTGNIQILDQSYVTDEARAQAIAANDTSEDVDIDLLPVRFKLVHANVNKNKDQFTAADLQVAAGTPVHKPLDWEHTDRIIGVITASEYVEATEDEEAHIVVDAVVYQFKFPAYAEEMINRHENDDLKYSMEVWFEKAECSDCNQSFARAKNYCSCLKNRFSQGSAASRILKGLTFGGAGVVENPADEEATSIKVGLDEEESTQANKNIPKQEDNSMSDVKTQVTFENQEAYEAAVQAAVDKALEAQKASQDVVTLQEKVESLEAQIATLQSESEDAIAAKDEEIAKAQEAAQAAQDELEQFKAELAAEATLKARLASLEEAGIVMPQDEAAAKKVVDFINEMNDEQFEGYKETVCATANNSAPANEVEEVEEGVEGVESAEAGVDVPNASTETSKKLPALENILSA